MSLKKLKEHEFIEYIRSVFNYNSITGSLTYKDTGVEVGYLHDTGHLRVALEGKKFYVHRLCWMIYYGKFPKGVIDHDNRIKTANWIDNLVDMTQQQNSCNCKLSSNNTSGHNGVTWLKKNQKWMAQIKVNRQTIYLGSYIEKNEAVAARENADILYNFHPAHGKEFL